MHLHILGICGTFMGGIAAIAREAGHKVTGCDANVYPPMSEQLRSIGVELIEGYGADQMALDPDVFVIGNVVTRARSHDFALMEAILDAGADYTSGPQWLYFDAGACFCINYTGAIDLKLTRGIIDFLLFNNRIIDRLYTGCWHRRCRDHRLMCLPAQCDQRVIVEVILFDILDQYLRIFWIGGITGRLET